MSCRSVSHLPVHLQLTRLTGEVAGSRESSGSGVFVFTLYQGKGVHKSLLKHAAEARGCIRSHELKQFAELSEPDKMAGRRLKKPHDKMALSFLCLGGLSAV